MCVRASSFVGVDMYVVLQPVHRWTERQSKLFFWGLGMWLGVTGAQSNEGELLGHVRDIGASAATERQFRTNALIVPHCDAADVVALLCLHEAKVGGSSRVISSVSAYNRLVVEHPEVVDTLYEPMLLDTRGSGGINYVPIEVFRYFQGELRTFYHQEYFRSAYNHSDAPAGGIPSRVDEAMSAFDSIINDPSMVLEMDFKQGDVQLLSNHVVLHSRTGFVDHPEFERKRHLLRLWLSLDGHPGSWEFRIRKEWHRISVLSRFIWGKVRTVLWASRTAGQG